MIKSKLFPNFPRLAFRLIWHLASGIFLPFLLKVKPQNMSYLTYRNWIVCHDIQC